MDHAVWPVSRERGIVSRATSVRKATPSSCQHVLCPGVLPPHGEACLPCERPGVQTPRWRVNAPVGLLTWVLTVTAHLVPLGGHPWGQFHRTPASPPAENFQELSTCPASAPRSPRARSSTKCSQGWVGPLTLWLSLWGFLKGHKDSQAI